MRLSLSLSLSLSLTRALHASPFPSCVASHTLFLISHLISGRQLRVVGGRRGGEAIAEEQRRRRTRVMIASSSALRGGAWGREPGTKQRRRTRRKRKMTRVCRYSTTLSPSLSMSFSHTVRTIHKKYARAHITSTAQLRRGKRGLSLCLANARSRPQERPSPRLPPTDAAKGSERTEGQGEGRFALPSGRGHSV